MVFKAKKKVEVPEKKSKEDLKKVSIAELRKQIEEAQKEVDEMEEEEIEEEEAEQEVPEIQPKKIEQESQEQQQEQLKLTAEEVISAIEFNLGRAGQLLQLLK